ncbi:MAG: hypothetical protein II634_05310, partial [Lachnospiraceae bacterium]|nr:hypothetical protein [Lachnospiraceae bacterium]
MKNSAVKMRVLISVCAVCCVALLGFGVWKSGLLRKNPGTDNTDNKTVKTTITPGETSNKTPTPGDTNTTPTPTEP